MCMAASRRQEERLPLVLGRAAAAHGSRQQMQLPGTRLGAQRPAVNCEPACLVQRHTLGRASLQARASRKARRVRRARKSSGVSHISCRTCRQATSMMSCYKALTCLHSQATTALAEVQEIDTALLSVQDAGCGPEAGCCSMFGSSALLRTKAACWQRTEAASWQYTTQHKAEQGQIYGRSAPHRPPQPPAWGALVRGVAPSPAPLLCASLRWRGPHTQLHEEQPRWLSLCASGDLLSIRAARQLGLDGRAPMLCA